MLPCREPRLVRPGRIDIHVEEAARDQVPGRERADTTIPGSQVRSLHGQWPDGARGAAVRDRRFGPVPLKVSG